MSQISGMLNQIKKAKRYIGISFFSAVVFLIILFPFSDLSEFISAQIAKATQGKVFLLFDGVNLALSPAPGIAFKDVFLDISGLPQLHADHFFISPSIAALIQQKPYGTIKIEGLMDGDLKLASSSGTRSDSGVERQKINLEVQNLKLSELNEALHLPVNVHGNLDLKSTTQADLTLTEQPDAEVNLKISQFELPAANINTMMGPLTLPELKLKNVELKGRLAGGRLNIEEGRLGQEGDELQGTIKGEIGLTLQSQGSGITPLIGSYNFNIDLQVKKSFQDKATLYLSFLDGYKSALSDGARYAFKINAAGPGLPPNISALR